MTIKEFIGKAEYDPLGTMIWSIRGKEMQMLADIRGWGTIQNMFKTEAEAAEFQDELGRFIKNAINEKIEREVL